MRSIFGKRLRDVSQEDDNSRPLHKRDHRHRFLPAHKADCFQSRSRKPRKRIRLAPGSTAQQEEASSLFTSLLQSEIQSGPVFAYQLPTACSPRLDTPISKAYSLTAISPFSRQLLEFQSAKILPRFIPLHPFRVVDAPDLQQDFYLNLLDWSSANILGVGLGTCVYTWTVPKGPVTRLCDVGPRDTLNSLSWMDNGTYLAVGTSKGRLLLCDASTNILIREYSQAHADSICSLSWNGQVISSGGHDGWLHHRDIRIAEKKGPFRIHAAHRKVICGLKWNPEGTRIASGGDDNKVCIWELRDSKPRVNGSTLDSPLLKLQHTSAVKALSWSPHQRGLLATGGGKQDRHIRFWNTLNGTKVEEVDTGSQVCNLLWSSHSQELVSTHGYAKTRDSDNQICTWHYPSLDMTSSLLAHLKPVLYLASAPDEETIVTGSGDETLRFWHGTFPKKGLEEQNEQSVLDPAWYIR
ncbi:WD40-repeat-containing domain protein [Mycena floridula]|nr:WD40-repeat-containing domain protein [Mycena floridula]